MLRVLPRGREVAHLYGQLPPGKQCFPIVGLNLKRLLIIKEGLAVPFHLAVEIGPFAEQSRTIRIEDDGSTKIIERQLDGPDLFALFSQQAIGAGDAP